MKRIFAAAMTALIVCTSGFFLGSCGDSPYVPESADTSEHGQNEKEPAGKTFFVSSDGSDGNDGSELSPLATPDGARRAVLSYKEINGLPDGGIEVVFAPGTYQIRTGLAFSESDSGEAGKEIVYRAADGGEVIFDGGVRLDPSLFVPASEEAKSRVPEGEVRDRLLEVDLRAAGCFDLDDGTDYTIGRRCYSYRQELYADNERQTVARWPNGDYEKATLYNDGTRTYMEITDEQAAKWESENIRYYGYQVYDWDASNFGDGVLMVDRDESVIVFLKQGNYPVESMSSSTYFVYNLMCELDAPGEYYWDTGTDKLYYYPDGDINDKKIVFSQIAGDMIDMGGSSYITFSGITFENGRSSGIAGSVSHLTVDGCVFRDFGGYAVNLYPGNTVIKNCEMYNLGSAGIKFVSGNTGTLKSGCDVITNNRIHDWAQTYTTGNNGIDLQGYGFTVSHNELCNSPDTAISFNCGGSLIEYNNIHDVCTETSDSGAIYSGRRWDWSGNVIRYNLLKDIQDKRFGGSPNGIYLDDNLSGQTCYGNILVNVAGFSFLVGGGKKNTVTNNIIVSPGRSPVQYDTRAVGSGFAHEHVVYPGGYMWQNVTGNTDYLSDIQRFAVPLNLLLAEETGSSMMMRADDPGTPSYSIFNENIMYSDERNLFADTDDEVFLYSSCFANVCYKTDPGFRDPDGRDYSLREDSRVYRDIPGFPLIDSSLLGVLSK